MKKPELFLLIAYIDGLQPFLAGVGAGGGNPTAGANPLSCSWLIPCKYRCAKQLKTGKICRLGEHADYVLSRAICSPPLSMLLGTGSFLSTLYANRTNFAVSPC